MSATGIGTASKIYDDPEIGSVTFRKNVRSRRMSIRVHPVRGVSVTVPYHMSYRDGIRFFLQKRDWILATVAKQKSMLENSVTLNADHLERLRREARQYLPARLAELSSKYGLPYGKVFIKNNRTNWGSCSAKGNINLNLHLMQIPEYMRDYVILHELAHLKHHNHGPAFHALLEQMCADHFSSLPDVSRSAPRKIRSRYPVSRSLELQIKGYRII